MIGVTVCGNIIPFIYHVLGTNAIIKGFMQYVVSSFPLLNHYKSSSIQF